MATCPSCAAMVEADATSCWHCQAVIVRPAAGEFDGPATDSGAPTLLAADDDGSRTRSGSRMLGREIIGQYVIVEKLGEGGMGEVYLADQPAIGRQVAIKVVHPQTRDRDHDDHVERFRNEAKAAASLESAHIVSIFNWGELDDGTMFMAMEYLPGQTLAQLLRERAPLEPTVAVNLASQICTALAEAHGAGIVHRDLKPSNIMLLERRDSAADDDEPQLFVKVLDFGVAKLEGSDITRSGAMFGTPQYMSPEQLRGDNLDGRSDLYSLGVILYEMLVGALPFSSPTAVGFITAHLHETPPTLPRTVPRALGEVVMQLLSKSADERPANAEAAAAELWAALGGRSTWAGKRARQQGRRRALRRTLAASVVIAALAGVGFGGWWMWDQQQQTEAELARERAEAVRLRQEMEAQSKLVEEARAEARDMASATQTAAEQAQAERKQVESNRLDRQPSKLDPETRRLLSLTTAQLEASLHSELDGRRVPPSEVANVLADVDDRQQRMQRGEFSEADLRGQLIAMIGIYRQRFLPNRRGDRLPLDELERIYLDMDGPAPKASRREQLDQSYVDYDRNVSLSPEDRAYFKRLVVAELIRGMAEDDAALDKALRLGKPPTSRNGGRNDGNNGGDPLLPPPEDDGSADEAGGPPSPPPPFKPPPLPGIDE